MVENLIKENDKNLEYSSKKSEIEDAQIYKKLSN